MSLPRQILPGATYLITRRTLRRHLLLRPDAPMRTIIVYFLAVCARRHGIAVHAFCAMSTHVHLVVTDPLGRLPDFLAVFHRLVALATKVLRKWEGTLWDSEQVSVVRLETPEAIIDKIGYVLANPVAAGLVRHAQEWPGAKSRVDQLAGGVLRAERPKQYLDAERGGWAEEAELELAPPPDVAPREVDAWRDAVADAVAEHEGRGRAEVEAHGWRVLGARAAARVSPYERATSFELLRDRNPTFAVGPVKGAYERAVAALRAFREAYRAALARWKSGVRDVVFPMGTWWMARAHAVVVAT